MAYCHHMYIRLAIRLGNANTTTGELSNTTLSAAEVNADGEIGNTIVSIIDDITTVSPILFYS